MRALGGVPIDRSARHGVVEQAIARLKESDRLALAVPPEGTRGRGAHWKTGFYHIARGAEVPIVLGFIDYGRKVAGLGPAFRPTGDLARDFEVFRAFYDKVQPKLSRQKGRDRPAAVGLTTGVAGRPRLQARRADGAEPDLRRRPDRRRRRTRRARRAARCARTARRRRPC